MERVFWVGARPPPQQLAELLAPANAELHAFTDVDAALAALKAGSAAVAIITADMPEPHKVVERLKDAQGQMQVLVANDTGIPRSVVLALWAGASGVLEFKNQTRNEIVLEIQEWVSKHRQVLRERELLLRLRGLNEEFLRTIVSTQKRAIELEEKLEDAKRGPDAPVEGPAQVLIVDDEPVVLDVMSRLLGQLGHQCMTAKDGETAVAMLWEHGFHVVITDKNLPGISGLEVMKQVRELSPATAVVMITGYASKESAIAAIDAGAEAYLEKPFSDVKAVRDRLASIIEEQRARTKRQHYLALIRERNGEFLERYRVLRADLEAWLASR